MDALSAEHKAQAETLISCGLPEAAALECMESVAAGTNPVGPATSVYACMKFKEGADMDAVKEALAAYAAASKQTAGKVSCGHMMEGGQGVHAYILPIFPHSSLSYSKKLPRTAWA